MSKTSMIDPAVLTRVVQRVNERTKDCQTLEQAAQIVTDVLFDELGGFKANTASLVSSGALFG